MEIYKNNRFVILNNILKSLVVFAICVMPVLALAQPESCEVKFTASAPTIKDYAKAYCSQFEQGSFERQALAAFIKGNSNKCVVDVKNGYAKYAVGQDGIIETLEMCFWNCDNKNEKLVAVNRVSENGRVVESFLKFYRYNVKTKVMRHIEPPFTSDIQLTDMVDLSAASDEIVDQVRNAGNEDANKYAPVFTLPRYGKDITFRMADTNAIQPLMQRTCTLIWDGSTFSIDR